MSSSDPVAAPASGEDHHGTNGGHDHHGHGTKNPDAASVEELKAVVERAGERLVVIDVRNPNSDDDQPSFAVNSLPDPERGIRPHATNLVWDRTTGTMPLPSEDIPKDAPIITHCHAGRRGQQAKLYLEAHGYTNVWNGAGPNEQDLWSVYGDK